MVHGVAHGKVEVLNAQKVRAGESLGDTVYNVSYFILFEEMFILSNLHPGSPDTLVNFEESLHFN